MSRSHYWVKVFASKQQSGEVVCECRVNNVVSRELTEAIATFAKTWESNAALVSDKQLFILNQRESTGAPYPYTREQIFEYTDKAIAMFASADTEEAYEQRASYRWIQERADDGFSEGRYSKETLKRLIYSSATCNVLSKALNDGSKLEDLVLTSLAFIVPEDYVIR